MINVLPKLNYVRYPAPSTSALTSVPADVSDVDSRRSSCATSNLIADAAAAVNDGLGSKLCDLYSEHGNTAQILQQLQRSSPPPTAALMTATEEIPGSSCNGFGTEDSVAVGRKRDYSSVVMDPNQQHHGMSRRATATSLGLLKSPRVTPPAPPLAGLDASSAYRSVMLGGNSNSVSGNSNANGIPVPAAGGINFQHQPMQQPPSSLNVSAYMAGLRCGLAMSSRLGSNAPLTNTAVNVDSCPTGDANMNIAPAPVPNQQDLSLLCQQALVQPRVPGLKAPPAFQNVSAAPAVTTTNAAAVTNMMLELNNASVNGSSNAKSSSLICPEYGGNTIGMMNLNMPSINGGNNLGVNINANARTMNGLNIFGLSGANMCSVIDSSNTSPSSAGPVKTGNARFIQRNGKKIKICRMDGCSIAAAKRTPYCEKHCGPRRCEHMGCGKGAQGRTRFCIAHGGGRRCIHPFCSKGARDSKFCAAHGGGKRCSIADCTKSAVGGSSKCTAHGGGKRCQHKGCTKSAQSATDYCVKHGGGRKCTVDGCSKVARGRTQKCMVHGTMESACAVDVTKLTANTHQPAISTDSELSVSTRMEELFPC